MSPNRQEVNAADPFLIRMRLLTKLATPEIELLERLCSDRHKVGAKAELVAQGRPPRRIHVLLNGWACRYRLLADGRRQISQLLIPGDICNLDGLHLKTTDFAVTTLTPCTIVALAIAPLHAMASDHPAIGDAFAWLGAVDSAMLGERNACLGRRSAREHLAHLLCELMVRLSVVGAADAQGFELPVTQEEIADVLGLTPVHVNRMLQSLRADGLIGRHSQYLVIRDWAALRQMAGFRPEYLHLEGIDGEGGDFSTTPWAFAAPSSSVRYRP